MACIIKNNKKIIFNRIVFYGCSLTAGSEIGHELFLNDEFKKNFKIDEIDKIKKNFSRKNFFEKYINNSIPLIDIENYSKTKSWANLLASKFLVDPINKSIPGSNNQLSIYNLNLDLINNFIKEDDLIIVGIAPIDRWLWIDKDGKTRKTIFHWDNDWPSSIFYSEFVTHIANDNQIFYNLFLSLKHLDLLSLELNGRLLMQFMQTHENFLPIDNLSNDNKLLLNEIYKLKSIIDKDFSFNKIIKNKDDVYGYGHPKEHHHVQMAEHIFERLNHEN